MTKFPKGRKPLQAECLSLPLSNQKEILKKGTTFKVQFIAIANPSYIDLVHQCIILILKPQTELLDSVHIFLFFLFFITSDFCCPLTVGVEAVKLLTEERND